MPRRPRDAVSTVDFFTRATIMPERRIDSKILNDSANEWAMSYLRDHSLLFLVDPDPKDEFPVYPHIVRSFYHTLLKLPQFSGTQPVYQVDIPGLRLQFTSADICSCLGFPPTADVAVGFQAPISISHQEMIDDMCQGRHDSNATSTRRSYLPSTMWMLDDAIRSNLCPIGHSQQRQGNILSALYYMYRGVWFDIGRIYLESILKAKALVEKQTTKVGRLYFPRLITRLLFSMGIRPPHSQTTSNYPVTILENSTWRQSTGHMLSNARRQQTPRRPVALTPDASHSSTAALPPTDHIQDILARLHRLEVGQQRLEHMLNVLMNMVQR